MLSNVKSNNTVYVKLLLFLIPICFLQYWATAVLAQDLNVELRKAALIGDAAEVKSLIEKGADVNSKDELLNTALICAIQNNKSECVITLIDSGADVNEENISGYPPVVLATCKGNVEMVKALLGKGADINARDPYDWTALMNAVYLNDLQMVKFLLSNGCDVNAKNYLGRSALFMAESLGRSEIAIALKNAGAVR